METPTMEPVIRALVVYGFLLLVFRVSGKRTLSQATTFDLVLLLIISETTQQAMVDDNHSLANAGILILTLVGVDIALSIAKHRWPALDPILDGTAVVLVRGGKLLQIVADRERVDVQDILEAARCQALVTELGQIELAVIERSGKISVIPKGEAMPLSKPASI
jgi:uncharacterized membrane protein YcaP (DUF421 family)